MKFDENLNLKNNFFLVCVCVWRGVERGQGAAGWRVLKPKQFARLSNEVKYKKQLYTQCRACGAINISKYVNSVLSTNPTTLILSSLVSQF